MLNIKIGYNCNESYVRWSNGSTTNIAIDHIKVCKPENFEKLIVILHELGHVQSIKCAIRRFRSEEEKNVLLTEIKAWQYVFQCIKPKYYKDALKIAIKYLKTYSCIISVSKLEKYCLKKIV